MTLKSSIVAGEVCHVIYKCLFSFLAFSRDLESNKAAQKLGGRDGEVTAFAKSPIQALEKVSNVARTGCVIVQQGQRSNSNSPSLEKLEK